MEYRNAIFVGENIINCEINHPIYGWIPFTCNPNDTGAAFDTAALFAQMEPHALPYTAPTLSNDYIKYQFAAAIDNHVEAVARSLQYNSAAHLASYVSSTVQSWRAEAEDFIAWRDQVWLTAFMIEDEALQTGNIPTIEELIKSLPAWARS